VLAAAGGVAAGFLTTVAGIGGGLTLVAMLSGFTPLTPTEVIGLTAPVLLVANAQRAWTYRDRIDGRVTGRFLAGGVPAAVVAAAALPRLPTRAIQVGIALLLLGFVAERLVRRGATPAVTVPLPGFAGVGLISGALSATVGGSGPFSAPFFTGRGLVKESFVATNAACNGTHHAIKTVTYALVGVITAPLLPTAAVAGVAVVVGNHLGGLVLGRITERTFVNLLLVALTIAAVRLLVG
jgi:uncharacterized membrane protein YfcA